MYGPGPPGKPGQQGPSIVLFGSVAHLGLWGFNDVAVTLKLEMPTASDIVKTATVFSNHHFSGARSELAAAPFGRFYDYTRDDFPLAFPAGVAVPTGAGVSSIDVPAGVRVECVITAPTVDGTQHRGSALTLTLLSPAWDLSAPATNQFNDNCDRIRVGLWDPGTKPGVLVYQNSQFRGKAYFFAPGKFPLPFFDNVISSLKSSVGKPLKVHLLDGVRCQGTTWQLEKAVAFPDLSRVKAKPIPNNAASCIEVILSWA